MGLHSNKQNDLMQVQLKAIDVHKSLGPGGWRTMLTFMGTGCISTTLRRLVSKSEMMLASILSQRGLSGLLQPDNGNSSAHKCF